MVLHGGGDADRPDLCWQAYPCGDQRILGVEHIVRGENGGAEKDLDRARPHPETALGKNLAPTPNRDWNDGNACLQSQDKTALLERKQTTIGAASSLRKHDDRNA